MSLCSLDKMRIYDLGISDMHMHGQVADRVHAVARARSCNVRPTDALAYTCGRAQCISHACMRMHSPRVAN